MPHEFKIRRVVEFADTDMAGIVHFANYFRYMEQAEHAFYRSLGFSVHTETADGWVGWPRVHARCDFRKPLRFEDDVEIHLIVREKRPASILLDFVFRKLDGEDAVEVGRGAMTVVCVGAGEGGVGMKARTIPKEIADQIEAAPAEPAEAD